MKNKNAVKFAARRDGIRYNVQMFAFNVDPMDAQGPRQMLVGPSPCVRGRLRNLFVSQTQTIGKDRIGVGAREAAK